MKIKEIPKKIFNACFPYIFGIFLSLLFVAIALLIGYIKISQTKVGNDLIKTLSVSSSSITSSNSSSNSSK